MWVCTEKHTLLSPTKIRNLTRKFLDEGIGNGQKVIYLQHVRCGKLFTDGVRFMAGVSGGTGTIAK